MIQYGVKVSYPGAKDVYLEPASKAECIGDCFRISVIDSSPATAVLVEREVSDWKEVEV